MCSDKEMDGRVAVDLKSRNRAYFLTYLLCGAESFLSWSRSSLHFMEPEDSLPDSQVSTTCPCPEQINPVHAPTFHFLMIHLNIIPPSTPVYSKWSFSLKFPHLNPVYTSHLPHTWYMARPSHSSQFNYPNNIGWWIQFIKLLIM